MSIGQQLTVDLARHVNEIARFEQFVVRGPGERDCWIWTGAIGDDGYGRFWVGRSGGPDVVRAARYALAIDVGTVRSDEVAMHWCDNPICVRCSRWHIRAGDQSQNLAEMSAKGRGGGRQFFPTGETRAERYARAQRIRAVVRQKGWDRAAVLAAIAGPTPGLFELTDL